MYQMSCRTIKAEMIPIKKHEIKIYEPEWHDIETVIKPEYSIENSVDNNFSFLYCVSYRDPSLPEWILARWFWNDQWIWTNDDIWNDF